MKKMRNKRIREVVINKCYGGFGLSHMATLEYYKRKGINVQCYDYDYVTKTKTILGPNTLSSQDPHIIGFIHYEDAETGEYLSGDFPRDDVDLVEMIKELGEKANGPHAELKIVEIPSDVKWHIQEYSGIEWIAEDHKTWK